MNEGVKGQFKSIIKIYKIKYEKEVLISTQFSEEMAQKYEKSPYKFS